MYEPMVTHIFLLFVTETTDGSSWMKSLPHFRRSVTFLRSPRLGAARQNYRSGRREVSVASTFHIPTLPRRRILFSGFVARMEDTRMPKCAMFVELVGVLRKRVL